MELHWGVSDTSKLWELHLAIYQIGRGKFIGEYQVGRGKFIGEYQIGGGNFIVEYQVF